MLSEEKIKRMIRAAEYESGQGIEDLKKVKFSKKDYLRSRIIKSVFYIVMAMLIFMFLFIIYDYKNMIRYGDAIYFESGIWPVLLFFFLIGIPTFIVTTKKANLEYDEAKARSLEYLDTLIELKNMIEEENSDLQNEE